MGCHNFGWTLCRGSDKVDLWKEMANIEFLIATRLSSRPNGPELSCGNVCLGRSLHELEFPQQCAWAMIFHVLSAERLRPTLYRQLERLVRQQHTPVLIR